MRYHYSNTPVLYGNFQECLDYISKKLEEVLKDKDIKIISASNTELHIRNEKTESDDFYFIVVCK